MPKVCTRKTCRREHDWPLRFKQCPHHREIVRRSKKKCRNRVKHVPEGHRKCTGCFRVQPEDQFRPLMARRATLTAWCQTCRDSHHRSEKKPNTKKGECRQVWLQWKKGKKCACCGSGRHIQADHCRGGKKVWRCSDYPWWAGNGGPEAQQRELDDKCQPLCMFCHRVKNKKESGTQTKPCYIRRQKIINDEKLCVGACETCNRVVTPENVQWFDWAHRDRATKTIKISALVNKSEEYFQTQWRASRHVPSASSRAACVTRTKPTRRTKELT